MSCFAAPVAELARLIASFNHSAILMRRRDDRKTFRTLDSYAPRGNHAASQGRFRPGLFDESVGGNIQRPELAIQLPTNFRRQI
jgi:hypothetical protein